MALAATSLILLGASIASGSTTQSAGTGVPVINRIAGGPGGPGPGTSVALQPYNYAYSIGGTLYFNAATGSGGGPDWQLNESTDWLKTFSAFPQGADSYGNLLLNAGDEVQVYAEHTGVYYGQQMTAGQVYTIAGNGTRGYSGDDGPAIDAELDGPSQVTADHAGNIVIADSNNSRIRVVALKSGTFYGQAMKAGDIYTVFGQSGTMEGVQVDPSGNLVIADLPNDASPDQLYVLAETTGSFYGQQMTAGSFYPVYQASLFGGLTTDSAGNVVFESRLGAQVLAEQSGQYYDQSMTAGQAYTIVSGYIYSDTVDEYGNLVLVGGSSGPLIRVYAVKSGTYYGRSMTAGQIYAIAGNGFTGYSGDGGPALAAELSPDLMGAGEDRSGNIVFTDKDNFAIRVLAEKTGSFYGQQMTAGDIYTIAGTGAKGIPQPNGVPAATAQLSGPRSVVVDSAGNVILTDTTGASIGQVLVIAGQSGTYYGRAMIAGDIYKLAGTDAFSAHLDHNGNLVMCSQDTASITIFAVTSGTFYGQNMVVGHIYKVAGGGPVDAFNDVPALQADAACQDAQVDATGNIVIANPFWNRITVVAEQTGTYYGISMQAGYLYTISGTGNANPATNGVPALRSGLDNPDAITFDQAGNLVIADTRHNQVRIVAASTGTFWGQAMKVGYIYLIGGNGSGGVGYSGDGGPATQASIPYPLAVRFIPGHGLLVTDGTRIRLISG